MLYALYAHNDAVAGHYSYCFAHVNGGVGMGLCFPLIAVYLDITEALGGYGLYDGARTAYQGIGIAEPLLVVVYMSKQGGSYKDDTQYRAEKKNQYL